MTHWRKSLRGAAVLTGLLLASGTGLLLGPVATAQPSGAQAAIDAHYQDKGGASSPLGQKSGAAYTFGPEGAAQDYQGGKIIYSAGTGAKVMYGAILDKYLALGGADAGLGYPTNDESDAAVAGTARFSEFSAPDGATIEWSPQNGAWLVRGPIRTAWSHLHATDGVMGAPMGDTTLANGVYSQMFRGQGGDPVQVQWSQAGGFVTTPSDIAGQLSGLDVATPGAPPGASVAAAASSGSSSRGMWWALPIGLVIAAAAGGLAALIGKPRSAVGTAPMAAPAGAGTRTTGSHLATRSERTHPFTLGGAR
ncbi:LGFP repeat-containing protein [Nocardia sp. NBC_00511]|uniref:LGFP repeat-containing protein n=1 Tax=Nocardia sp. NBC_00511 TaxID=2903591 RepID=UPI0030DF63E3